MTAPPPQSYNPEELMGKCTVSGSPSCPMLRDALSQLTSDVRNAKDEAQDNLHELEMESQQWQHELDASNARFAEATGDMNAAEEELRQKVLEANTLTHELAAHREECSNKIREG